jgi:hypothetical protein
LALGLAAPAVGAEDEKGELERLRQENQGLKAAALEQDITAYLAETKGWAGAQGGDGLKGVTLHATFTTVFQGTLGQDPNIGLVDGDFDLDFDFQVNDRVALFAHLTANNGGAGSFPGFGPVGVTAAGGGDGIDVNGTVPTNPGAVVTNEVGVRVASHLGQTTLNWEMGEIDPRLRFLQNAFVPNNNVSFIHNSFADPASVQWITTAAGTTSLGWYMWLEFGGEKQFTLSWGWFNTPGQWFSNGQFYLQFGWKGEVSGREMNLRLLLHWDEFNPTATDDDNATFGWSWDWWIAEKVGLFITGGFNTQDTNPVEYDFQAGFVFSGMVGSRPDDQFGIGLIFTQIDEDFTGAVPEATEFGFEIYYRLVMGDGKVHVTPHVIYILDPGGGVGGPGGFTEDNLFIVGVRMHVPF